MKKIICFGDSNTFGFNPNDGSRYNSNTRWTGVLAKILGEEYKIAEAGCNNRTGFFLNPDGLLQSGQKYLQEYLERNKDFETFILALGTNDLQSIFKIDENIAKDGLKNLITIIRKSNQKARIIIISPVVLNENVLNGYFSYQFDETSIKASNWIQEIYENTSQKESCELLNLNKYVTPSSIDGLHFDSESHKKIANLIANVILERTSRNLDKIEFSGSFNC